MGELSGLCVPLKSSPDPTDGHADPWVATQQLEPSLGDFLEDAGLEM